MVLIDNEKINNKRKLTFELYRTQFDRYISDSKKEVSTVKGYQGRELLELIQNAEDECCDRKGTLKISLVGNQLRIENSGNPFSFDGILSLMTANYSPKDSNNYIGNKGLGFRSVLSWSDSISIFSSKISVRFSRSDAEKMQQELKENADVETIEKYQFDKYRMPIFSAPNTNIDYIKPSDGMDTLILLECKDDAIERILAQFDLINGKELLFLRNLGKISISHNDTERFFVIVDEHFAEVSDGLLSKKCLIETHEADKVFEYAVYQANGEMHYIDEEDDEKMKMYILSLAIPSADAPSDSNLYSFFRTNIKSPFRFILNATFDLDDNRKYIFDNNDFNTEIIARLPKFIIDAVSHNYSDRKNVSYDLLNELLIEDLDFLSTNGYDFKGIYIEALKNAKVFPTVNNEFIDYCKNPVLYKIPFAQILKGDEFVNLLQYTEDARIIKFFDDTLKGYYYIQDVFAKKINTITKGLSIINRARLIKYFVDYYGNRTSGNNLFPMLLLDSEKHPIESKGYAVFNQPKEAESNSIPELVKLRFVNRNLFKELQGLISFTSENKIRETIEKYLKYFGVAEYSLQKLEPTINKIANENLNQEQVLQLMQWVYKIFCSQKDDDLRQVDIKIPLPISKRESIRASKLYFSDKYNNSFYYGFLKRATKEAKFVASKEQIGFKDEEKEKLIKFFAWLGVADKPRKVLRPLFRDELLNYYKYCEKSNIPYSGQVWCYEFYDDILENLSTTDILKWVLDERETANSPISSKNELQGSYINYYYSTTYQRRQATEYNQYLKSYVRWQLGQRDWIAIKNEDELTKCSLANCLLESIDIAPYLYRPTIDYKAIGKYCDDYTETKVKALLEELGAKMNLADLKYDRFYELLYELPTIDKEMRVTRKIYDVLFDTFGKDKEEYKEIVRGIEIQGYYKKFTSQGKVLAQLGKNKVFAPVNSTVYFDRKDLCNGILNEMNILDIERKKGQEKVSAIFGVKTLSKTEVDIERAEPHQLNDQFQELLKQIKPFLVVYRRNRNKQSPLNTIKGLDITLCTSVDITYSIDGENSSTYGLSQFENIFSRKTAKGYLCIPNDESVLFDLKNKYPFYESLSELLAVILGASEDKAVYQNLIRDSLEVSQQSLADTLGDRGLSSLEQAQIDLGEIKTNQDVFWSIIKKAYRKSITNIVTEFSSKINYEQINAAENWEAINALMKLLAIPVEQFNANSEGRFVINLSAHWKEKFAEMKRELTAKYQAYVFDRVANMDDTGKLTLFISKIKNFNFSQVTSECNCSLNLNIEQEFEKLFAVSPKELRCTSELDFEAIKTENLNKYELEDGVRFEAVVSKYGIDKVKEVALFAEFDSLVLDEPDEPDAPSEPIVKEDKTNSIISAINVNDVSGKEVSISPKQKNPLSGGGHQAQGGGGGYGGYPNKDKTDDIGFAAEMKVFKELCRLYKEENVSWVSRNAERGKAIPIGAGKDYLHYDIVYLVDGIERFIEVKGSTSLSNISIKMSKHEYDFGNDPANIDRYDIHYVIVDGNNFDVKDYFIVKDFFKPRNDGRRKYELIQDTFTLLARIEDDVDK